jgi:hypothetical protein
MEEDDDDDDDDDEEEEGDTNEPNMTTTLGKQRNSNLVSR